MVIMDASNRRTIEVLQHFHSVASKLAEPKDVVGYLQVITVLMDSKNLGDVSAVWLYNMTEVLIDKLNRHEIAINQERVLRLLHLSVVAIGRDELEVADRMLTGIEKLMSGVEEAKVVAEMFPQLDDQTPNVPSTVN